MRRPTFFLANLITGVLLAFVWLYAVTTAEGATKPVPLTICEVWKGRCAQALAVSWCESRWNTEARNGIYWGLFQVSSHWRRTVPGWGPSAEAQARHALRVFKRTGSTWAHWSCRP